MELSNKDFKAAIIKILQWANQTSKIIENLKNRGYKLQKQTKILQQKT